MGLLDGLFKKKRKSTAMESSGVASDMAALAESTTLSEFETQMPLDQAAEMRNQVDVVTLPLFGARRAQQHRKLLTVLLAVSVLLLVTFLGYLFWNSTASVKREAAIGKSLTQSQRMAKAANLAALGRKDSMAELRQSADVLQTQFSALVDGNDEMGINALSSGYQDIVKDLRPEVSRSLKNANVILAQSDVLEKTNAASDEINKRSSDLLELAETVVAIKLEEGAPAQEVARVGDLVMLTQRISKSTGELLTVQGQSPEGVFLLGKDLNAFREVAEGLLDGSESLGLEPEQNLPMRERLDALLQLFSSTEKDARLILDNLQNLVSARKAQAEIISSSESVRDRLERLQLRMADSSGFGVVPLAVIGLLLGLIALLSWLFSKLQLSETRNRQQLAELQSQEAKQLQLDTKRVNDANQAAILRLMNELQVVAEGDLTQEATVTEDITGAIADSVNYTVEELRSLVANVQTTATRVAQTSASVDGTSTELLAASTEQLREIRQTGESVLGMAQRINQISAEANETADVATQSRSAAEKGYSAVQNAIGGMNVIRDQIQDTAKRIKRLGESSQEIGEITELISDITEQTNVLALNAAIQAASAGEAGRGFSVVAEEVQRLAERSADATKQIAALVKTIQTDTQDAVAAMERSTNGVVEGAKLSDNAGSALNEIDRISARLSDLIDRISQTAAQEAQSANVVAQNIQQIFAVTEQTGEGTRATAAQVRDLSRVAEELRQSVARFTIA